MMEHIVAARYRLTRLLGEGAMGAVWLATDIETEQAVALKVIHDKTARDPQALARFKREAKAAADIDCPYVCRTYGHGSTERGRPFIVMEVLQGETLRERIQSRGRLTARETARVVHHVCTAMAQAHDKGLVHRDLKPDNIFAAHHHDGERFVVLDFGVAKATDLMARDGVDPTKTGTLLGTPYYMSPEQARGLKSLDHRADLWSIGVVAFECLTGFVPFQADSLGPLVAKIIMGEIPSPSSMATDNVNAAIDQWMAKALQREAEARFATADELCTTFLKAVGVGSDEIERELSAGELAAGAKRAPAERKTDQGTVVMKDEKSSGSDDALDDARTLLLESDSSGAESQSKE